MYGTINEKHDNVINSLDIDANEISIRKEYARSHYENVYPAAIVTAISPSLRFLYSYGGFSLANSTKILFINVLKRSLCKNNPSKLCRSTYKSRVSIEDV